ncbi:phage terminase large subunit [Chengkuizengella axinellae]|uniref:Phage terminase large subunit n=1 Tax=Chengkuizengella axinellae TaxID=3064388 RepID=A0ABT9IWP1_9BACL|nr:phage terminase large subunit [Chengkuizengella sp. 2205SS18-9]MDP5273224.1 phage terminase large subunit [Chengkuizengella sp. 2205SS18-9]
MAYVDGKWLDRKQRAKRIKLIQERARKLKTLHESGKASEYYIEMFNTDLEELKRLKRIHRAEVDNAYFTYEYLSDEHNSDNEDNIVLHAEDGTKHDPLEEIAPIHREFFDLCDYVDHDVRNARLGIAAARGHSKSGMFSNSYPLHQTVYRKRKYILIISETDGLAKKLIGWVNKQLKFNKKLIEDFGPLLYEKNTMNEKDNEEAFITLSNTLVEASSSGKQLRGKRHGSRRPDLVIVDDPSSIHNEGTKEAREKLIHWFNSVVVPIGTKSTAIILVGTMVSATGLLNHVLKRKDFKSSFHGAIIKDPDNPKLWEEYCEIYSRSDDMDEANEFYVNNKEKMEQGIVLAWSWRWTYRDLMHEKVNMGTRAFNSEFKNLAFSEDEQFFFPESYAYFRYEYENGQKFIRFEDMRISVDDLKLTKSGFWDIAMGKNARSCYNAVITVGRYEKTGHIFVMDEYASKEQPHKYIDLIVEKIRIMRHNVFSVETINAQHEFFRQLKEALRKAGLYKTKMNEAKSHKRSKEERIESLEPMCHNRTIVFNASHTILLDQMTQYPHGDYVDSLDALSGAVENVAKAKKVVRNKPSWL